MTNTPSTADNSAQPEVPVPSPASSRSEGVATGAPSPAQRTNLFAILSIVTAFFASILAVIAGHVALRQISRTGENGRGLAIAGLVLGYVGLVLGTIAIAIIVSLSLWSTTTIPSEAESPATSEPSEPAPAAEAVAPDAALSEFRTWTGTLALNDTELEVTLDGEKAPIAVASFLNLVETGYFEGTSCHRITTQGIFVLQCGDPTGTGMGGPGYSFGPVENAPADGFYPAGTLAMARVGNDGYSNGSQFFIVYQDSPISADAAGGYTVFGTIDGGLDYVQQLAASGAEGGAADGAPAVPAVIGAAQFQ